MREMREGEQRDGQSVVKALDSLVEGEMHHLPLCKPSSSHPPTPHILCKPLSSYIIHPFISR